MIKKYSDPFDHIQTPNALPLEVYDEIMSRLPDTKHYYKTNLHENRFMCPINFGYSFDLFPDIPHHSMNFLGREVPIKPTLSEADILFWVNLIDNHLKAYINLAIEIFELDFETICAIDLIRDFPGYYIGPHTDHPTKATTMFFYLPRDGGNETNCCLQLLKPEQEGFVDTKNGGFHFDDPFITVKEIPFKKNTMFAFKKTNKSFHCVNPISDESVIRNSLVVFIYRKEDDE